MASGMVDKTYHTVTPYLVVSDVARLIEFLVTAFDARNVTHDGFRWITLPIWLAIATAFAGLVWRWTGNFLICIALLLLIGLRLNGLAEGVGHPQLWVIAAPAILLLLAAYLLLPTEMFGAWATDQRVILAFFLLLVAAAAPRFPSRRLAIAIR